MARQKIEDNLFYVIFRSVPTWATVTIVVASYPVLHWLLPAVTHGNLSAQIGSAFAPWLTAALALIGLYAEADKFQRRRLVSRQSSLDTLRHMGWLEFEHLVGEAYRRQGYKVDERGGAQADGGIDLVLNGKGETVLVQCKQWKTQDVGVKPLREFAWVVQREKATRGIFVICGSYSKPALEEFERGPLELIDGSKLLKLIQEVQAKSTQAQPARLNAQAVVPTMQAGQTVNEAAEPACPKCGSPMNRKLARQGANTGNEFWCCPNFPNCRGTRSI